MTHSRQPRFDPPGHRLQLRTNPQFHTFNNDNFAVRTLPISTSAASIEIVPRQPEHDEALVGLRNAVYPDLAPLTLDLFRHYLSLDHIHPEALVERYAVTQGSQVVAGASLDRAWGLETPGCYSIDIRVAAEHRGQGIGRQVYDFLDGRLKANNAKRVYSGVKEGDEHAMGFATRRGFTLTGHTDRASRLAVSEVNWEGYEGIAKHLTDAGISISRLDELTGSDITMQPSEMGHESLMRKLHTLFDQCIADIPGPETFTGMPFEVFMKEMDGPPGHPNLFWIAMREDEPVGLATLMYRDDRNYYTGLTATARSARGLGIARGVKQAAITWAQSAGIQYLFTDNDVHNTRMLAINIRLGFKPIPSTLQVVKEPAAD
jgi:mycothiol synthase